MRAVSTDRRLEAIAGKPARQVTVRAPIPTVSEQRTVIFVGRYEQSASEQYPVFGTAGRSTIIMPSGELNLRSSVLLLGTSPLKNGDLLAFYNRSLGITNVSGNPSGIGRFIGDFHAAVYDRALTDREALAVARSLSLSLSLSG